MRTEKKEFTVGELSRRIAVIDLEPDFQRTKVWSEKDQQYLIDTIFRGWGIPKLYLAEGQTNNESYFCIDGKQRLITIFEFLQNKFKSGIFEDLDKNIADKFYQELPIKVQDKFDKYKLDIELVKEASDEEISELFKRLQKGKSLNSSEKLKASKSEVVKFAHSISKSDFFKKTITVRDTRNQHLSVAVQIVLLGTKGEIQSLKYKNLESFIYEYRNFNDSGASAKNVKDILKFIHEMYPTSNSPIFSNKGNIISIFFFIYELSKKSKLQILKPKLVDFFNQFYLDINNGTSDLSSKYKYATVQSPDSITSIKTRNELLKKAIVNFDKEFELILNVRTLESEFRYLYFELEKKHGDSGKFRLWLREYDPNNVIKSSKRHGDEDHIIMFVRDSLISHPNQKKCSKTQIAKAISILKTLS